MFEARLAQGFLLKKLADALKELVDEANFCASSNGLNMHAMDKSHVGGLACTAPSSAAQRVLGGPPLSGRLPQGPQMALL